eukprot:365712-Chlamydomonas_euryale.AAC.12
MRVWPRRLEAAQVFHLWGHDEHSEPHGVDVAVGAHPGVGQTVWVGGVRCVVSTSLSGRIQVWGRRCGCTDKQRNCNNVSPKAASRMRAYAAPRRFLAPSTPPCQGGAHARVLRRLRASLPSRPRRAAGFAQVSQTTYELLIQVTNNEQWQATGGLEVKVRQLRHGVCASPPPHTHTLLQGTTSGSPRPPSHPTPSTVNTFIYATVTITALALASPDAITSTPSATTTLQNASSIRPLGP